MTTIERTASARDGGLETPKPTTAELEILRALWQLGPSTVGQVRECLRYTRESGYTTVLKLLQIMHEKGLVERDESQRAHIYRPRMSKERTQNQLIGDLVSRLFDGSSSKLVLQALGNAEQASPEDLARIRKLLDEIEKSK